MTWSGFLGLASSADQNSAGTSTQYDSYARPTQSTGVHGAITTYSYGVSPWPTITATTDGHWTRTTLDGLGRTIKVETGDGSGTKSEVDTAYGPAGLDPLGKMVTQSEPYAQGFAYAWTTYSYDGLGRTTSVVAADGASTTTYSYVANTVTATDPAGNAKTFTMDAEGNITQVVEPGGLATSYSYSVLNQLVKVQQTRGTTTQTRSWTYNGVHLTQTTMPETGTTNYTYNSNGTLAYKIDAKNQKTAYTYDGQARVTLIQHYPAGSQTEDICQRVSFIWDVGPPGVMANSLGHIGYASYQMANCASQATDYYGYDASGLVTMKQMNVVGGGTLRAEFSYNDQGQLAAIKYPDAQNAPGATWNPGYDTMGRLNGLTANAGVTVLASGATYGPAGELLGVSTGMGYSETRQYNAMKQLTQLTTTSAGDHVDFGYSFSASQNNGKITQMTDSITGETVSYQYDSLLRLASATSNQGWSQAFGYDGFGNLTNVTAVNAPGLGVNVNAANNRLTSDAYDANGNDTTVGSYDIENRLVTAGGATYGYDASGKRVYKQPASGAAEYYFWAPNGQRLGTYTYALDAFTVVSTNVYFGGRLLLVQYYTAGNPWFAPQVDRLGSNVSNGKRYYPYGGEKPSATGNEIEKFTGYFRDAETGNDYAVNRYYQPGSGRFTSADPYVSNAGGSGNIADPGSWNRYTYAGGDPVNRSDPSGKDWCIVDDFGYSYNGPCGGSGPNGTCWVDVEFAALWPGIGDDCEVFRPVDFTTILILIAMGGGGSSTAAPAQVPAPEPAPQTSCEDAEENYVFTYLYERGSPLASYSTQLVTESDTGVIDDRFIVGLAGVETTYGTNQDGRALWGRYNAFDDGGHCNVVKRPRCSAANPYPGWGAAISGAIGRLDSPRYSLFNSVQAIYNTYEEGNPNKTSPKLGLLDQIYGAQLKGNLDDVRFSRCTPGT
jgi:RHS repeat-associated protein